jgi:outer membrane lipoprotein SlyB
MTEALFIVVIIAAYVIYVIVSEQTMESGSRSVTAHAPYSGEIEKEHAHVSTTLLKEARTVTSEALDLIKHPGHYAQLEASLAAGEGGESLGEIVGASLGTVFGPEGTVIFAEVGGMAGEVFGARQGGKIAQELLHQSGTERPLKEDLQKEGSAKVGSHAGKIIGGMIGNTLFDDVGSEIGEAVGDKIGNLAGNLAFEHIAKIPIKNNDKPNNRS